MGYNSFRRNVNLMVSKKWNTDKNYIFIDPETASRSSPDRNFVYAILINEKDNPRHHPIFIGHTDNLEKRLDNHKAISWHNKIFGEKPLIWIAGTALFVHAEKSVIDLETKLSNEGFLLFNKIVKRGSPRIETLNEASRNFYTNKDLSADSIFMSWKNQWKVKDRYIRGNEKGREKSESKDALEENENLVIPSKPQLLSIIRKQKYTSNASTLLSQQLAASFNQEANKATYLLPNKKSERNNEFALNKFKAASKEISADWQFLGIATSGINKIAIFELTVNLKRKIARIEDSS